MNFSRAVRAFAKSSFNMLKRNVNLPWPLRVLRNPSLLGYTQEALASRLPTSIYTYVHWYIPKDSPFGASARLSKILF